SGRAINKNFTPPDLWLMFKTVVLLEEQVRARDDPQVGALLDRLRAGTQTREDFDLLNTRLVDRSQITLRLAYAPSPRSTATDGASTWKP
ncbi:hypothetical protein CEP51_016887, partial [Fusarium floridanum]